MSKAVAAGFTLGLVLGWVSLALIFHLLWALLTPIAIGALVCGGLIFWVSRSRARHKRETRASLS